jgi:hypothetical protein
MFLKSPQMLVAALGVRRQVPVLVRDFGTVLRVTEEPTNAGRGSRCSEASACASLRLRLRFAGLLRSPQILVAALGVRRQVPTLGPRLRLRFAGFLKSPQILVAVLGVRKQVPALVCD